MLARLALGHPRLSTYTLRPERVSIPGASLTPLFMVHPLMLSPFLAPATACHMMRVKADAMRVTQRVAPFLDWLRAALVEPQQGIVSLTSVDLPDSKLSQRQGISKSPPPFPSLHSLQAIRFLCRSLLSFKPRPHCLIPRGTRRRQQSGGERI